MTSSAAESAGFLGISEANVRVIRHRAIRQLRACMELRHDGAGGGCRGLFESDRPAVLMDYWLALLPASNEEAVEEHLLVCDRCGDRLREAIASPKASARWRARASLRVVVSDQFVQRAAETRPACARVRTFAPGQSMPVHRGG